MQPEADELNEKIICQFQNLPNNRLTPPLHPAPNDYCKVVESINQV